MNEQAPRSGTKWKVPALVGVAIYIALIVGVAVVRPLTWTTLAIVIAYPWAFAVAVGIPPLMKTTPRTISAIFYLGVYPLGAVITMGLPGALLAAHLAGWI